MGSTFKFSASEQMMKNIVSQSVAWATSSAQDILLMTNNTNQDLIEMLKVSLSILPH